MSKKPSAIDLSALKQASRDFDQREAARRLEEEAEQTRLRQREDAANELRASVTLLNEQGAECRFRNVPFDGTPFAAGLVQAFFRVCEVMREQQLGSELDSLDEDQMIAHYGQRKEPELARIGYQAALKALTGGIAKARGRSLEKQLTKTVETIAGRHLWYMLCPIVRGLLIGDGRLFRKTEAPSDPAVNDNKRRPCYDRDHLWLEWSDGGLKPAGIRDRWNNEYKQHRGEKIAPGRAGRNVVKEGLRKAREETRKTN